ncbi:MAG: hypothetical protein RIQ89_337 [Bacteroidota bacterium]|jgi:hypothetical protein
MQDLEPFYAWRDLYQAESDPESPFYGRQYSEFEYSLTVYNYYLHPQWDAFGSTTLYIKILYADYVQGFAIIEMIGEWNDALYNDIMFLKREIAEFLVQSGISKFILIGENVLNFHGSDDSYYEEWFQDIDDGWIAAINFRQHVLHEMEKYNIDYYFVFGGDFDTLPWRNYKPGDLFMKVESMFDKRLTGT